jgi:hypothetical protein
MKKDNTILYISCGAIILYLAYLLYKNRKSNTDTDGQTEDKSKIKTGTENLSQPGPYFHKPSFIDAKSLKPPFYAKVLHQGTFVLDVPNPETADVKKQLAKGAVIPVLEDRDNFYMIGFESFVNKDDVEFFKEFSDNEYDSIGYFKRQSF